MQNFEHQFSRCVDLGTTFGPNSVRYEQRTAQTLFVSSDKIGVDMESVSRPRSTRDRPAKAPLSEDVILDTALRLVKEEGLEAVTMRRIATELDTGPASLYVYISGRQELRAPGFWQNGREAPPP